MPKLPKLGRDLGFQSDKNIIYGKYEGYNVTMYHKLSILNSFINPAGNFKKLFIALESLSVEQESRLLNFISENRKELIIRDAYIENSVIIMTINEDIRSYSAKRFNQTMSILVELFKKEEVLPISKCVNCGEDGVDSVSIISNIAFPSHKKCDK